MSQQDISESVIRTPDQRLRVFVSSTLAELAEERAAVARVIMSLGLAPVMFELGARPHPPQELYRAYLAQSDVFIGLYWQSYGWVGPDMDISGLEDEFRLSRGRPRLLYLKAPAPDRQPRLSAMIDEIRAAGTDAYRTFSSSRELGRLVRDDLAVLLSERFVSSTRARTTPPAVAARRTLPVTSTTLIGRTDDIRALVGLLERADVRLVNVTGPGGMGKTRLAIAVGEAVLEGGSTPVTFVPLAAITDASEVLPRVAAAVGAVIEGTRSARDALVDHFADTTSLLVLDNLEQIAAIAPQLDDLLAHVPRLKILATSRVALRLRAEHEYVLGALPAGAGTVDLPIDEELSLPAVQLFLDRANAVRRGIPSTADNVAAIAEICRRLDGVPLAIELAAARTRLLEPVALLARLENVLDALGTGPVDLPERQRTLRATVEWSVGLLGDAERALLSRLAVFVDGWTLAAAAAVGADDEDGTLELLDVLAGHSLVGVDAAGREPRFRMLTSVHEYAAELLAGGERAAVERRHADHFAGIAEAEVPAEALVEWIERLRADEENLRGAIRWLFEHDVERLPHLLRTLWMYWQINDRMSEGRLWVSELQRRVVWTDLDERAAAELLYTAAVTATEVGDDEGALAALASIKLVLADVDDPALQNMLRLAVSWTLPIVDDVEGALEAARAAYDGFAADHDPFVASAALTMGMLSMSLGDDESARRYLAEVDEQGSRFGVQWLTSSARTHLAIIDVRAGDHGAARDEIRRTLDDLDVARTATLSACLVLSAFGHLAAAEGRPVEAVTALAAMDGLRARAGVLPWPNSRRSEGELRARVMASVPGDEWDAAYAAGCELRLGEALSLVRADLDAGRLRP